MSFLKFLPLYASNWENRKDDVEDDTDSEDIHFGVHLMQYINDLRPHSGFYVA